MRSGWVGPISRGRAAVLFWGALALLGAGISEGAAAASEPPFDSTADTVFDIIQSDDPSSYVCLENVGRGTRQMWDKRVDAEFDLDAFLFRAYYSDGPAIEIVVNPEFGTPEAARAEALRYARPLGQLPPVLRQGIRQFGIHKGDPTYSAGPGKIFVYAGRTDTRLSENRLEESLLHEAVHASLDRVHADSPDWRAAQDRDGAFVTGYARDWPDREDLAETAIFAYAFWRHPDRLPPADSAAVPARLAVLTEIFETGPESLPASTVPDDCQ